MSPSGTAKAIRRIVLERSYAANVGHIGSNLSVADIIAALYASDGGVLNIADPDDADRDRFVLSCGHKALALYAALHLRGWISEEEMSTFCQDGSPLYTHSNHEVRGVDFSTGSLGMGLSFACGAAMAAKMQGSKRRVYCLLSDGDLQEGSTWEAIMFAVHHPLDNLVAIVDANGQQALGKTADICDLGDIGARFAAFGWSEGIAFDISAPAITRMLEANNQVDKSTPTVLVVPTTFGDGVSFMEAELKWHYKPMSTEDYTQAIAEVTA